MDINTTIASRHLSDAKEVMSLRIYNSLTRQKELFTPVTPGVHAQLAIDYTSYNGAAYTVTLDGVTQAGQTGPAVGGQHRLVAALAAVDVPVVAQRGAPVVDALGQHLP